MLPRTVVFSPACAHQHHQDHYPPSQPQVLTHQGSAGAENSLLIWDHTLQRQDCRLVQILEAQDI